MATYNYVKFVRGTSLAFNKLTEKNSDTLYFITDDNSSNGSLYLGNKLISGIANLNELENILIQNVENNQVLVYDATEEKWINKSIKDAIGLMAGASATEQGGAGLVPAPGIGQQNLFLRGDGTWAAPEVGSSASQIFEVVASDFSYDAHVAALTTAVDGKALTAGDIGIVKVLIAEGKYQYTAYVYNGTVWAAMDGNYSSDSIYFDEDLTVTVPIGTITQTMINDGGGSTTIDSANKNMTQVLSSLLAEEKDPSVDKPSANLTASGGSGEVGTTFTLPTATFKVTNVGSYTYGSKDANGNKYGASDTGIVFAAGDVVLTQGDNEKKNSANMVKDSTLTLTATGDNTYGDSAISFTFKVSADYTASDRVPLTNLGNKKESLKIEDGSVSVSDKTVTFTGYRKSFHGSAVTPVELNSANIRELSGKNNSSDGVLSVSIVEGAKQVVLAVPSGRKVTKVADEGAFGTDIFSEFSDSVVAVEGHNGYTAKNYNVYTYNPSTALGANTYTVTVTNE